MDRNNHKVHSHEEIQDRNFLEAQFEPESEADKVDILGSVRVREVDQTLEGLIM